MLNLATGMVITQHKVTPIPMTQYIIDAVEAMAESQGMKELQVWTKSGHILYDSFWIAGVDYDVNEEEDLDNDNESDQDKD